MTDRRISYVDVFTTTAFLGNPVAVVLDTEAMGDEEMAAVARWTNLSETTFVVPSAVADFGLRIFTTGMELPFAGHPTVGSTHAVIEAGIVPSLGDLTMECSAGIVPLRISADGSITATTPRTLVLDDRPGEAALEAAIGPTVGEALVVDAGPRWMIARMVNADAVRDMTPDMAMIAKALDGTSAHGLTVYGIETDDLLDNAIEVRSLVPGDTPIEDPVCGSGNAAVGRHLSETGGLAYTGSSYVARQGRPIGRDGFVRVDVSDDGVAIGGHAVTVVRGEISI